MTTVNHQNLAVLPLIPGRWAVDPNHSVVSFSVRHLGLSKVRGRFNRFDAVLDVGNSHDDVRVEATVDLGSIDTGNADRDAHVLSPELLDVERRPLMQFASQRVYRDGDEWRMEGDITIAEVTRPVVLEVEFGGVGEMLGQQHAGFGASGTLSRKDFGLEFDLPPGASLMLGDAVRFELDMQFLAPASS